MNHESWTMNDKPVDFGFWIADCEVNTLNSNGFTLIETIIVLVIMAILAAVAIPRIGFDISSRTSVEGAAYMIASDLRYAQEFAMANRVSKTVAFTSGTSVYNFSPSHNLDPSGRLPSGVTITKDLRVKFNSLGEPTFEVGDGTVTISGGGTSKTIHVENYTGKVSIP